MLELRKQFKKLCSAELLHNHFAALVVSREQVLHSCTMPVVKAEQWQVTRQEQVYAQGPKVCRIHLFQASSES